MSEHHLDAKGLKCPIPVLKARRAMKPMADSEILVIEATDPGAPADFVHFCEASGHELLSSTERDGVFEMRIRKAGD